MQDRILIIARDFNAAKHWALRQRLSPGHWVYVSSYHNIEGNRECGYIKIPGYELRPDVEILDNVLQSCNCFPKELTQS